MDAPIETIEQLLSHPDPLALLRRRSIPLPKLFPNMATPPTESTLTCPICGTTNLWPYQFRQYGETEVLFFLGHCRHVVALVFATAYTDTETQTIPYLVRVPDFQPQDEPEQ